MGATTPPRGSLSNTNASERGKPRTILISRPLGRWEEGGGGKRGGRGRLPFGTFGYSSLSIRN